ncbi:MAG: HAMP domain-containing sensor histidine kinase [Eubacteriales bacterium]
MKKKYIQARQILDFFSVCDSAACSSSRAEYFERYVLEKNSKTFFWETSTDEKKIRIDYCFFCFMNSYFKNSSDNFYIDYQGYRRIEMMLMGEIAPAKNIDFIISLYKNENNDISQISYFHVKGKSDNSSNAHGITYFVNTGGKSSEKRNELDTKVHEIKNQMMMMMAYAENIQRETKNIKIKRNTHYIKEIIYSCGNMLSLLYGDQNGSEENNSDDELFNVHSIINAITESFAGEYNTGIVKKFGAYNPRIYADKNLVQNAIYNIIINAIQACGENGKVEIKTFNREKCEKRKSKTDIYIQISDNGTGIKKEDTDKVFQKGFTTKDYGMGIGLYSVKRTIEMYNGNISVKSKKGKGTTFVICLPCHVE